MRSRKPVKDYNPPHAKLLLAYSQSPLTWALSHRVGRRLPGHDQQEEHRGARGHQP